MLKSWRCDILSCGALDFDAEDDIKAHQNEHLIEFCRQWVTGSTCPWRGCRLSALGKSFMSIAPFRKHLQTHLKSKWCHRPGCGFDRPFGTEHDLRRHIKTIHDNNDPIRCPLESCSQSFIRNDKLEEHVRKAHNICRCLFDHCGMVMLDDRVVKNDHLMTFHKEQWAGLYRGMFECALTGCESTTSRFNSKEAKRHLNTAHGISDKRRYLGNALRTGEDFKILTMPSRGRQRIRPCKICIKKRASSGSELQAVADGDNAESMNGARALVALV